MMTAPSSFFTGTTSTRDGLHTPGGGQGSEVRGRDDRAQRRHQRSEVRGGTLERSKVAEDSTVGWEETGQR